MTRLLLLLAVLSEACVAAAVPPSRSEAGSTLHVNDGEIRSGTRLSTGAHWASASIKPSVDYDVGAGYVYERLDAPVGDITSKERQSSRTDVSHGGYLSAAAVLSENLRKRHRTWVGGRLEYLHTAEAAGGPNVGILARVDWEVHAAVRGAAAGSDSCGGGIGFAYGAIGLGLYLETGVRVQTVGDAAFTTTAGVSLRLPFLGGLVYNLCGH